MGCCCSKKTQSNSQREESAAPVESHLSARPSEPIPPPPPPSRKRSRRAKKSDAYYMALWDYEAGSKAEVNMKKGDIMEKMDEDEDAGPEWIFVTHVQGVYKGTGYVPRNMVGLMGTLEVEEWFFADTARPQAQALLKSTPDGTFMIRSQMKAHGIDYVLSVSHNGQVKHYRIKIHDSESDERGRMITRFNLGQKMFDSLKDFVSWFSHTMDGIPCLLKRPPAKQRPPCNMLSAEVQRHWQEIPRRQIQVEDKLLGQGKFGVVRKGEWKVSENMRLTVAVKELKRGVITGARKEFLAEAVAMKSLLHDRLVKLYGVVSADEPFWIITEYVQNGSLKDYLKKRQDEERWLDEEKLVNVATQVADGMRYLESKHVVHCDLAARNVLVAEKNRRNSKTDLDAKIADFGMVKTKKSLAAKDPLLPVRWCAPEVLTKLQFSSASDVWSFGILLHETFTYGSTPYRGMGPKEVKIYVANERKKIERAEGVPEKVYQLISYCCEFMPDMRPTFQQIHESLDKFYGDHNPYEKYRS